MSAHMSHGGEERLVIPNVYEPRGMAIDYSDQSFFCTLFWSDIGSGVIRKINFIQVISNIFPEFYM